MELGWMLIPVVAILAGVVREWIRVANQQQKLGSSTNELEKVVADLRSREQALIDRIENLEAIVVSQTWEVLQDKSLSPPDRDRRLASTANRELAPPPVPDSEKAEVLARRLKA